MKDKVNFYRIVLIVSVIALFAWLRVFIEIPNVHPLMAMALLGGTFINRKWLAIALPLMVLAVSDLILGIYSGFLMAFVYGSFVIAAFIGFQLRKNVRISNVVLASLSSSIVFFVLTNFAVWAEGLWYPMTAEGLGVCFAKALPFFRFELAGTMAFTLLFFGIYQVSVRNISALKTA